MKIQKPHSLFLLPLLLAALSACSHTTQYARVKHHKTIKVEKVWLVEKPDPASTNSQKIVLKPGKAKTGGTGSVASDDENGFWAWYNISSFNL